MNRSFIGVGVALCAGIGTAFFAAFHNPAFIAIGAGIGAAICMSLSGRRKPDA